uniref:Putative secreted protein n=1 Tax=Xenopsylla cheopis TaxID=163159 RepID=A0A6M2E232_XENCH
MSIVLVLTSALRTLRLMASNSKADARVAPMSFVLKSFRCCCKSKSRTPSVKVSIAMSSRTSSGTVGYANL